MSTDPLAQAYLGSTPTAAHRQINHTLQSQSQQQQPQQPGTPQLASTPLSHGASLPSPILTAAAPPSGLIQLLPATAAPTAQAAQQQQQPQQQHGHSRSQSTFVPMHSPGGSLLGQFDLTQLGGPGSRQTLPIGLAGILATPAAGAATSLTSPMTDYAYPVTSDGYDVYGEIGSGAFSTVYRGVVRDIGEEVAIKVIDLDLFNTNWEEIRREIQTLSQVRHDNVVKLKTAFVDGQDLWIVMSLLTAGSCAAVMKELGATNGIKDEVMIATILKEVLQALAYFHKHGSIHRDVKAGNVLISGQGDVQLADFGVAGTLMEGGDRKKNRQTFTGTPCWMAPEVMEHTESEGYDEKADIWSFGITAMELGYGRAPYAKFPPMKVMLLTLQEEPPTCAIYKDTSGYEFSKHYHNMISKCLRRDPKKRPTVRKLLEHKFFQRAADSRYLFEHLVSRLPPREQSNEKIRVRKSKAPADLPIGDVDPSQLSNTATRAAPHPGAGVKLGSWVFDEEDITAFKNSEGEAGLDLLTGTLQHQHMLPHHHPVGGTTGPVPEEEEDEDYIDSTTNHQQQQHQQHPAYEQYTSQLHQSPQTHAPLSHPFQPHSPQQQQYHPAPVASAAVDPPDFFAGILAPAEDHISPSDVFASTLTGRLSPSAAFAAASSGRLSPSAAFAAATAGPVTTQPLVINTHTPVAAPRALSNTTTPTLSSVQGKTRQFVVSDSELPADEPLTHQTVASSPPTAASIDLLSDNLDLHQLSAGTLAPAQPSASEQFMAAATGLDLDASAAFNATSSAAAADPLNLDALSLTPGSATMAYLAAMGELEPTPAPVPATTSPVLKGTSPSNQSALDLRSGSPSMRPLNTKRASGVLSSLGPLSSLLPVQMPVLKAPTGASPPAGHSRLAGTPPTHPSAAAAAAAAEELHDAFASAQTYAPVSPRLHGAASSSQDVAHLHLLIPSSPASAHDSDAATSSTNERQVGRFQVTSSEQQ